MNRKTKAEPFYRHLHFVYSDSQKKAWKFKLYTQVMICELTKKQITDRLSSGYSVVLNTLPAEYYAKEHIPNSYNLHYETIKRMSVKQLEQWMKGNELNISSGLKGFVVMKYKNDFVGTGKASAEKITNFIPKNRRLKEKN